MAGRDSVGGTEPQPGRGEAGGCGEARGRLEGEQADHELLAEAAARAVLGEGEDTVGNVGESLLR